MEHVKSLLAAFLDRELAAGEARRVEAHLPACAECRSALEELRSVSRLVAGLARQPLPPGFMQRLERRKREGAADKPGRSLLPFPARVAAFALSSLIVMFVIYGKAKVLFPVSTQQPEAPRFASLENLKLARPEDSLRGSALKEETRPQRALARAKGEPISAQTSFDGGALKTAAIGGAATGGGGGAAGAGVSYNNEALHKNLELQTARMGIKSIAHPEPQPLGMRRLAALGGQPEAFEKMASQRAAAPPVISGATPALLSRPAPGVLVRSELEQADLWRQRGIKVSAPALDYSHDMLVVVFAETTGSAARIIAVNTTLDRVVVQYREIELSLDAAQPQALSYQFKVIPKTNLPVSFEKVGR